MKVKVNVSVFLGVVLCVALMGGMWLMRGKNAAGDAAWNPNRIYSTVGGAQYSSGAFSLSRSEGLDVSVPMSSSRTYHRATPSFASAYNAAASAVASRQSSMPSAQSPISYTSSAANYHSFGNAVASGASAGSFRASNNSNLGAPASLSVPSMPTYASARTISASQSGQAAQASSGVMAAAPAVNSYGLSFYNNSFGYTTTAYAGSSLPSSTYLGAISGRRNSIEDITYIGWLTGWFGAGAENITKEQLIEMYIALGGDFTNPEEWEAFWEWIQNSQSEEFQWKLQPLSDAPIFMLLLCLAYIVYVARKRKKQELA